MGIGYYLSANIVKSAIDDWNKNPVITSLDSIATPIDDVQFPTVTVCNDKGNEVHDNWAFIESLLNFLHFYCDTPSAQIYMGEYCNGTNLLRHDFKYLFESILDINKAWLFQEDNFKASLKSFEIETKIGNMGKEESKLLRRAIEVVSAGNMSMEEIMNIPLQNFNKEFTYQNVSLLPIYLDGCK